MAERETTTWMLSLIIVVVITRSLFVHSKGCNNTTQGPYFCKCPCSQHRIQKCYFINKDAEPLCICKKGHQGIHCAKCQNGWYQSGNFSKPGSICVRCNCTGNLDLSKLNSCDPNTGKCLKCLPGTTGECCEHCADGFHGDAVNAKNCTRSGLSVSSHGKKHINKEVIIISTCTIIGIVCVIAIAYLIYQRHRSYCIKGRIPKFWTVEIANRNYDDMDFSLLDPVPDTPFVYRNDAKDFEEALIAGSPKSRLSIDVDAYTEDFEDTTF